MGFSYSVTAEFDDAAVAAEWAAWLKDGYFADVLKGGAQQAQLIILGPLRLEARYLFSDEASFRDYEREVAPALRAEGLAKFPPSRGVRMSRLSGTISISLSSSDV